jgi:hypothetical protein
LNKLVIMAQIHACQVMRSATANAFSFSSGDKRVDKTGQPGHWAKLEADLLADLAAAIDSAISTGASLGEFRKAFRQIVADRGWHGWTGEGSAAGQAWRTRIIYTTNTRIF